MAARYSKFLPSRNRFAKSACNSGLVSRFGTQSETARRGQKIQNRNRKTRELQRVGTNPSRHRRQRGSGTESKKGGAEEENRSCNQIGPSQKSFPVRLDPLAG